MAEESIPSSSTAPQPHSSAPTPSPLAGLDALLKSGHYDIVERVLLQLIADLMNKEIKAETDATILDTLLSLVSQCDELDITASSSKEATGRLCTRAIMIYLIKRKSKQEVEKAEKNSEFRWRKPHLLYYVAESNDDTAGEEMELFITSGMCGNPSQVDEGGRTPLYVASLNGRTTVFKYLLSRGADINKALIKGWTKLHLFASAGDEEMVESELSESTIHVNSRDDEGRTALHLASENGHLSVVKSLVRSILTDVNVTDFSGRTPLYMAALHDHLSIAKTLINRGANVMKVPTLLDIRYHNPLAVAKSPAMTALLKARSEQE